MWKFILFVVYTVACIDSSLGYDSVIRADPGSSVNVSWLLDQSDIFSYFDQINITFGAYKKQIFSCSPLENDCVENRINETTHAHRVSLITSAVDEEPNNGSDVINSIGFRLRDVRADDAGLYHLNVLSDSNVTQYELLLYVYQKPTSPSITGRQKLSKCTEPQRDK